jgi:hypothetical protein
MYYRAERASFLTTKFCNYCQHSKSRLVDYKVLSYEVIAIMMKHTTRTTAESTKMPVILFMPTDSLIHRFIQLKRKACARKRLMKDA